MTYNVLNGGAGREVYIREVLQLMQPDIVVLQEVYQRAFVQALGELMGMTAFFGAGNRQRRVALLSRFPLLACESHRTFPPIWRNTVRATLEYRPGKKLHILGVHPMANLAVPFELWRWWEARYNISLLKPFMSEPCLIAGDLNAIAPSDPVNVQEMPAWLRWAIFLQGNRVFRFSIGAYQKAGFSDCFRDLHPGEKGYTLPPPKPNARLDYILVNAVLHPMVRSCSVVDKPSSVNQASDHYPLIAEFEPG
ncbi:MAG: endonuclease/exonuclease/phosphatase family protein [Chloroflexota bacterium]